MIFFNKLNFRHRIFLAVVGVNLLFMAVLVGFDFYKDAVWLASMKKQHLARVENRVKPIFDKTMRESGSTQEKWERFQQRAEHMVLADNVSIKIYDAEGKSPSGNLENEMKNNVFGKAKEFFTEKDGDSIRVFNLYEGLYWGENPIGVLEISEKTDKILFYTKVKILMKQYLLAIIIMFILSGYVAWFISNALMKRLWILERQLPKTNIEYLDTPIVEYKDNDEISPLINSYNDMLRKLKQQTEQLTQIEREESWREMAKQIVHEISNPLTPLKLLVQNFQRKFNPNDAGNVEKVNKLTESIIHQVDVIYAITQSFSEYSKAPLGIHKVDIVKNLRRSLEIFPSQVVDFQTNDEEVFFKIDETYFTRVITNLVKNAIQSIPHQNKKVEVRLQNDAHKFLISIKDNGVGIAKEHQDKIFERKFTTKSSGMGIGLSIVKKIVEDYNGKIWFESEEGIGTTFYVEFYK